MTDLQTQLLELEENIARAKAGLREAYAKSNAQGIMIPANASKIRATIQNYTDQYNEITTTIGPSGYGE